MDGMRDGLASVQLVGKDFLVTTRSGLIALLDAETGETRWRTRLGTPYRGGQAPAVNSRTVLVATNIHLYALNRANGQVQWQFRLPTGVSAPLAADDIAVYAPSAVGHLYEYYLPRVDLLVTLQAGKPDSLVNPKVSSLYEGNRKTTGTISHFTQSVREAGEELPTGIQPLLVWDAATGLRLESKPLVTRQLVLAVGAQGICTAYSKVPDDHGKPVQAYNFDTESPILVPAGQFGDVAYIGAQDANLYALDMTSGRVLWRHSAGDPVSHRPAALEQDIYVAATTSGLARLDRATGEPLWRVRRGKRIHDSNPEAERFLAANAKFVYALDRLGRLLVLDRRLGHLLSTYDVRDFVFPIINDISDRLYLAANDGLIVCMHDKEYTTSLRHHRLEEELVEGIRRKLAEPITDPGDSAKLTTLREMLDRLATKYGLKFSIAERAFAELGREAAGPKLVSFPKVDNKPLGEVLQQMLTPINATYEVVEDTVVIVPGAAGAPKTP
jgi:outer membrane protein assembly factor BamB